jgi:hypothetical protein
MKTDASGSVLVIFLFFAGLTALLLAAITTWGGQVLRLRRTQIALKNILTTVLRTQAASLESLATDGSDMEAWVQQAQSSGAFVNSSDWSSVGEAAGHLKSSFNGHKGRLTAVRRVITEANRLDPDELTMATSLVPALGILPQGQWISDESGHRTWIDSLWFQRRWSPTFSEIESLPEVEAIYRDRSVDAPATTFRAKGHVVWEGQTSGPHAPSSRNGGYPRSWDEARVGNRFYPYRQAYFSSRLSGSVEVFREE